MGPGGLAPVPPDVGRCLPSGIPGLPSLPAAASNSCGGNRLGNDGNEPFTVHWIRCIATMNSSFPRAPFCCRSASDHIRPKVELGSFAFWKMFRACSPAITPSTGPDRSNRSVYLATSSGESRGTLAPVGPGPESCGWIGLLGACDP